MSQELPLTQSAQSVQQVLTANTLPGTTSSPASFAESFIGRLRDELLNGPRSVRSITRAHCLPSGEMTSTRTDRIRA